MISKRNIDLALQVRVVIDCGVQIEQNWEVDLLVWVQQLIFEAETLNFGKVQAHIFWVNLVDCNSCNRLVTFVEYFVECQRSFTSIYGQHCGFGLKFPWDLVLSVGHKVNSVLAENAHILLLDSIVLSMGGHREAKGLADHSVEGNCEKIASQKKQTEAINAVKLTPLSLVFKHFVYLYSLTPFSH